MPEAMKSIILNNAQARVLRETGELVVFDVFEEQPPKGVEIHELLHNEDGHYWHAMSVGQGENTQWFRAPSLPGEWLWLKEDWVPSLHGLDCLYRADELPVEIFPVTGWKSAAKMMRCDSRTTVITASVEPVRVQNVSEKDIRRSGLEMPPETERDQPVVWAEFGEHWDAAHHKPEEKWDANPWCWKRVLKVER